MLIGNLTRDPELRYTPTGVPVCTIGLATNRTWSAESGEKKEETEFHRVVAWNKLAELCGQLLTKGRKVYVEGRLRTSTWQGQDGNQRSTTEVIIEDMILLDSRRPGIVADETGSDPLQAREGTGSAVKTPAPQHAGGKPQSGKPVKQQHGAGDGAPTQAQQNPKPTGDEDVNPDDIPF